MLEITGYIQQVTRDIQNNNYLVTIATDTNPAEFKLFEKLKIKLARFKEKRSLDANGLFWACVGELAKAISVSNYELYIQLLKDYGVYTEIVIPTESIERLKSQWREIEVLNQWVDGETKYSQVLAYYGSSTYNTAEMSRLIDGTIKEMQDVGLTTPTSAEMQRSLEEWEKRNGHKNC